MTLAFKNVYSDEVPDDVVEKQLNLARELTIKEQNTPRVSSTLFFGSDSVEDTHKNYICHNYLSRYQTKRPIIIAELWYNPNDGQYNDFFQWICDKNKSPWRLCLQGTELVDVNGVIKGLIFYDTKVNRSVLPNFLIGARFLQEYGRHDVFQCLTKAGMDGATAFVLMHQFNKTTEGFYLSPIWNHCAIYLENGFNLKRFVEGDPDVSIVPSDPLYSSSQKGNLFSNKMWGAEQGDQWRVKREADEIIKQFSNAIGVVVGRPKSKMVTKVETKDIPLEGQIERVMKVYAEWKEKECPNIP